MKRMKHIRSKRPATASRSPAGRLLLGGHILILLSLCDFTARLVGHSVEHFLYTEHFIHSLSVALVLLWGAALGVDYLTHTCESS